MDNPVLQTIFDFIHLMATILWIGGMMVNTMVIRPALSKALEPEQMAKAMGLIMKKFRIIVYVSIALLAITGIPMKIASEYYGGIISFENSWQITGFIKHVFVGILSLLAIYNFEIMASKMKKAAILADPGQRLKLQKQQMLLGMLAFFCGIAIILLSAIMNYL